MSVMDEDRQRERARLRAALALFGVVVLAIVVGLVWAGQQTAPQSEAVDPVPAQSADGAPASPPDSATGAEATDGAAAGTGWDLQRQGDLATRPMPSFPDEAALPQTLATSGGLAPMLVPGGTRAGLRVPEGFPPSAEGAVGQLAALLEVELRDVNPSGFAAAYRSVSLPGAPAPEATPLGRDVANLYAQAVTGSSEPTPLASRWQLAGALIKGQSDGGRFVVACVIGELQVVKSNSVSAGTGDCQAMRWTGRDWRISPGPAAARPPVVWPGSDAFVQAGYRPTQGGAT